MFQFIKNLKWEKTKRQPETAHGAEIARGWDGLSLRRFYAIRDLQPGDDYDLQLVSILSGIPVENLEAMPLPEFQDIKSRVDWVKREPMPDVHERTRYVIDGPGPFHVFQVEIDIRRWNAGQYIDYQNLGGYTETPEAMAAVLCCYLVPDGHTYGDGYDFDALKAFFVDHFPALDAFALHNFFVMRSLSSITSTKTSWVLVRAARSKTEKRRMRALLRQIRDLTTNGGGLASSMPLPKNRGFLGSRRLVWELSKCLIR